MRWFFTMAVVTVVPGLPAQHVEVFCDPQVELGCIPDTLEIVFTDTDSSVFEAAGLPAGAEIACSLVTDTKSEPIQGWSYAVKHDASFLTLTSVTTEGTIVDPNHPDAVFINPGFNFTDAVPRGWLSAIVLSFITPTQLPVDTRNVIATANYQLVTTPEPAGTLVQIVDRELGAPNSPAAEVTLSLGARSMRPETLVHGLVLGAVPSTLFQRGDSNANGRLTIADAVFTLRYLFDGLEPPPCMASADSDDNSVVEVTDLIYLLSYLFLGEAEPPEPFGACGTDPTPDGLGCDSYAPCESAAPEIPGFTFTGDNAQGYPEYTHDATGIVFVRLPGGTFHMGSPEGQPYRVDDEGPVHEVILSPFLIAKYELTQGEWAAVMGNYPSYFDGTQDEAGNPIDPPDDRDRLPVESVSWHDIQEFEAATGLGLPTEAQWEYACRGGTDTAFSFGSGESCEDWVCGACPERDEYMRYCGNAERRTHEVGTKLANPFGLHDMHGNVYEWCEDVYDSDFYSTPEAAGPDPVCTSGSGDRVDRGGGVGSFAWSCRSSYRGRRNPTLRSSYLGFRPSAPSP